MKAYKVSFLTYHESYNGYDLCDGWSREYEVDAAHGVSAISKARKLWSKDYHNAYWTRDVKVELVN
jgi:hypothetical protein